MQPRLLIGNPFKYDAIFEVNRKAKKVMVLPVQFMHFESLVIAPISKQLNLFKSGLPKLRGEFLQASQEFRRKTNDNHTVRISLLIRADFHTIPSPRSLPARSTGVRKTPHLRQAK
jgi:hypothetical protein